VNVDEAKRDDEIDYLRRTIYPRDVDPCDIHDTGRRQCYAVENEGALDFVDEASLSPASQANLAA
jgi:hypothetical protein